MDPIEQFRLELVKHTDDVCFVGGVLFKELRVRSLSVKKGNLTILDDLQTHKNTIVDGNVSIGGNITCHGDV